MSEQVNAPQVVTKSRSNETVTVACKLPHGLVLRAFNMIKVAEPVMGGGSREVPKAQQVPGEFIVLGTSFPQNGAPRGRMEGGYTLTTGCPKELWERWLADNKDTPMVKNGLIFAHDSEKSAVSESREKELVRSGFERLDPNKLPKGIEKAPAVAA